MKPHDALQVELDGISSGATDELRDLLALAEELRATASQIGTPPGLQARRGAILTAATAGTAPVGGRRLPRLVSMAGALVAGAAIGWVAAFATGGLDNLRGPGPAANPTPLESPDKRPLESETPRPSPSDSTEPSPSSDPSPSPVPSGIEKPDDTPEPAETPDLDDTPEPDETPDEDNSGSGSDGDSSGSGSDGDSSGSGSGSGGDSSGSGSGDDSP